MPLGLALTATGLRLTERSRTGDLLIPSVPPPPPPPPGVFLANEFGEALSNEQGLLLLAEPPR